MNPTARPAANSGAAIYIAVVQFLFVTTWTVYVVFLPQLLASAGLPKTWAPWILVFDQLVFLVADVASGVFADRVQRTLGRLGPWIVGATAVSCGAFLLMPHAAQLGAAAPGVLLVLILVWAATSSALRAPPWVLLGKHAARPARAWLSALTLIGLAAGGAVAPFLGVSLKNLDPRLPFALSSLALLATTAGIVAIERGMARQNGAGTPPPARQPQRLDARHTAWLLAVLLLAAGFQTHFSLNAAAAYLRFATPDRLEWLMPLFWVGYAAGALTGGWLCARHGALKVMAAAAAVAAAAALVSAQAGGLNLLIAAQLVAGAAWGCMQAAMFSSAGELGRTGREGLALGAMFGALALATLVRIGVVLGGLPKNAALAPLLGWLPVLLWAAGGAWVGVLAWRAAERPTPTASAGGA